MVTSAPQLALRGAGGGDGGVCTDAAEIQPGRARELHPAPGIKDFSSSLRGDVQHKKDFSRVLVVGDAKGPGGPLCS